MKQYIFTIETKDKKGFSHDYVMLINVPHNTDVLKILDFAIKSENGLQDRLDKKEEIFEGFSYSINFPVLTMKG